MSKNDIGFSGCFQYGVNEGPCVFDDQCKDNLFCGYKNCPASFANDDADCCGRDQFKSPNYPNYYFPNDEKTWLITAPIGSIIRIEFHTFDVGLITVSKHIQTKWNDSKLLLILYSNVFTGWWSQCRDCL